MTTHTKYLDDGSLETIGDPTEAALVHYGYTHNFKNREQEVINPRKNELPFDSARKMMSTVNQTNDGLIMYTKGAFEIIKKRCTKILDKGTVRPITDADFERLNERATGFAKQALRVLGYAYKPFEEGRRTYSNILKIFVYLVSLSIAEIVLLTTLIAVFNLPFFNLLLILWINVVTDTLPAIALGSLPAEHDIMKQKPNKTGGSLFRGVTGLTILVHAVIQTIVVLLVYLSALYVFNWEPIVVITMSYVVLGTVETVHPFNLIHYKKSVIHSAPFRIRALNWAVLSTVVLVVGSIVLPIPGFQNALG